MEGGQQLNEGKTTRFSKRKVLIYFKVSVYFVCLTLNEIFTYWRRIESNSVSGIVDAAP